MTLPTDVAPFRYTSPGAMLTNEQCALLRRAGEAQRRTWKLFSEPVARALSEALQAYIDFGHRFSADSQAVRLIDDILSRTYPRA